MKLTIKPHIQLAWAEIQGSPYFYIWISFLAALMLLAGYALVASLVLSMEILEFSIKIPWATMVSAYTWLVVAGSGLCIVNALGVVFGMHRYELMAKRIVFLSLTSIIFGLSFILLHLGRPERVLIYNFLSPNFGSAISWMGALYNIYLMVVTFEFWLLIRDDLARLAESSTGLKNKILSLLALRGLEKSRLEAVLRNVRIPQIAGTVAFLTGVGALTMLGSVFAHAQSRTLWYGPYYPIYFLISALFLGYALLLSFTILAYYLKRQEMPPPVKDLMFEMAQILAGLLAVGFAFSCFRLVSGLFDPGRQQPVLLLLKGPFSIYFWVFEVGLMSAAPIVVLIWSAIKRNLWGVWVGSLMVFSGGFVMRYVFIVAGQVFPNIPAGLPAYRPTLMEMFVIIGVFSAFLAVISLAEKFFPLSETKLE